MTASVYLCLLRPAENMISVIIPTFNRSILLKDCLESLTLQTLETLKFEVILVDNGSTDDTRAVAESFHSRLQLKYIFAPESGLHIGRHAGMHKASSEILVFCDDDIIADPSWLESISGAFRDSDVTLVGGNNRPLFESNPPVWLQRLWNRPVASGQALAHLSILDFGEGEFDVDPGYIWGCNFAVRRNALEQAGGFHPDSMPYKKIRLRGDGETAVSDYIRKSGLRARFHAGASVRHRVPVTRMSMLYFKNRSYAQGISDSYTDFRRIRKTSILPIRQLQSIASCLRKTIAAGFDDTGRQLINLHMNCLSSYLAGYNYHQQEARCDAELRAWILKENYF